MQKKIIVLAIAAAFAAPAFAETANVTVYGAVGVAVESINVGDNAVAAKLANKGYSVNKVSSNTTKLGFKGTKDLGDGVSAIWQIEQQIDIDNSSATKAANGYDAKSTFATRNSFAGLSDKAMGTVQLGKMDTPYKASTRGLDAFGDSLMDNRSLMGGVKGASAGASFDDRQGDVIAYTSPTMGGLTVAVAYVAGAENATAATVNRGSATSLAAMYKADALYATVAYEAHTFGDPASGSLAGSTTSTGQKETAVKFGVGYKIAALDLSAAVERTSDTLASTKADTNLYGHHAFYVAAKYSLSSSNTVKLAYTKAGETNNSGTSRDDSASQISVGFDHSLDKSTLVFAQYTAVTNADGASYGLATAGSTGGTAAAGPGSRVSALALGMKHAF